MGVSNSTKLSLRQVAQILGLSEPRIYQMDEELKPELRRRGEKMITRWYSPEVIEEVRARRSAESTVPGSGIQVLWQRLNKIAEHLNVEVRIEIWDMVHLGSMPCHFCGAAPISDVVGDETIVHNELDRLEPSGGFTILNSIPCCSTCQRMKGGLSGSMFLRRVMSIVRHRTG